MFIANKDREEQDRIIEAYQEAKTMEELEMIRRMNQLIIRKLLSQYQIPINDMFQQRARQYKNE